MTSRAAPRRALIVLGLPLTLAAAGCAAGAGPEPSADVTVGLTAAAEGLPAPVEGRVRVLVGPASVVRTGASAVPGVEVRVAEAPHEAAVVRLCEGDVDAVETATALTVPRWEACRRQGLDVVEVVLARSATTVVVGAGRGLDDACVTADAGDAGARVTVGPDPQALEPPPDPSAPAAAQLARLLGDPAEAAEAAGTEERARDRSRARALLDERRAAAVRTAAAWRDDPTPAGRARAREARAAWGGARAAHDRAVAAHRSAWLARQAQRERSDRVAVLAWPDAVDAIDEGSRVSSLAVSTSGEPGDCVRPDPTTVADGSYPLADDVRLLVSTRSWQRPEVAATLAALLPDAAPLADRAGLVPAAPDVLARQLRWLDDIHPPVLAPDADGRLRATDVVRPTPLPPPAP